MSSYKNIKYKSLQTLEVFQSIENTINTSMASNHINHTNSRTSEAETQKILIHYWQTADDILFMPRYESMRKSAGSFIKWYIKGGSIKPLPLNKASIVFCNRTERARTHMRRSEVLYGRKSSSASVSEPDLIKNLTFTSLIWRHTHGHPR